MINTFIIKKQPIIDPNPIIVPNGANVVLVKSVLIYLLTGQNFITSKEKTPDWMREKKATKAYLENKIQELEKENDWLTMAIFDGTEETINQNGDNIVENLDKEYQELQEKYGAVIAQSNELAKQVTEFANKLQEDDDLLQKC